MARKIAFSPASIDNMTCDQMTDPLTPGLSIQRLGSGNKRWLYRRLVAGKKTIATIFGGLYPAQSIADARVWARDLNAHAEAGRDPRVVKREEKTHAEMSVAYAHSLYMTAVKEGRGSRAKRKNKPTTIALKSHIYKNYIDSRLGTRNIYGVSEDDLINLVEEKAQTGRIHANRIANEICVFFG
ncbi:Arm DNA-binding domain-containing protein [Novosphingobium terrae]|uniref:Arm DNA-binding domain-containing protein n=1 Tax=Novosphingobium terrae TaxID=2726189 RepID=UPI00197D67BC|nr:Arm DNA-binding domain-containing protein [Novosphingobium terrae]